MPATAGLRFVKGHGTENDFVLLPDPDGLLELTADLARAVCHRRSGVGGDGVLRVVRSAKVPEGARLAGEARWFMDYRNADGSLAEMCGNGVRVYARYLVDSGLVPPGELRLATRAGVKLVTLGATGDVTVDMGPPQIAGPASATIDGQPYEGGRRVTMGNPHAVFLVASPVASVNLTGPVLTAAEFPQGGNVEVANAVGDRHAVMRVFERGVGETRSCGTGACAVAAVLAERAGVDSGLFTVDCPGGRLTVALDGTTALLSGPAVLVGEGVLRADWLNRASAAR